MAECDWADFLITLEYTTPSTTAYAFTDVNYSTLKHKDGKLVHELLGFASWDELAAALGEIGDSPADSNLYYRMKYTDPGALWVSTGP